MSSSTLDFGMTWRDFTHDSGFLCAREKKQSSDGEKKTHGWTDGWGGRKGGRGMTDPLRCLASLQPSSFFRLSRFQRNFFRLPRKILRAEWEKNGEGWIQPVNQRRNPPSSVAASAQAQERHPTAFTRRAWEKSFLFPLFKLCSLFQSPSLLALFDLIHPLLHSFHLQTAQTSFPAFLSFDHSSPISFLKHATT